MLALVATAAAFGCATSPPENTVLQSADLQTSEGQSTFDRNNIVDSAAFVDTEGLTLGVIQNFFTHTPYKRPSFLETYQSNGVRAVDAIMNTSARYRLNPLVFLVRLEMAQGLLGEQFYPFPPARVEYVFGCGCITQGTCDPALAGLDKQLDCLGRALRTSLDEIKANNKTSGGWGPSVASMSVDAEQVTPANDATAALYQYTPVVGAGKGGNWLFWNIWQNYAAELPYRPPSDSTGSGSAWIGDPCTGSQMCDYDPNGTCMQNDFTPGGLCSFDCSTADCPADPQRTPTFCATQVDGTGHSIAFCAVVCNPAAPACRPGYKCVANVPKFGDPSTTQAICYNN